jgi:hypothetical protein
MEPGAALLSRRYEAGPHYEVGVMKQAPHYEAGRILL